MSSTDSSPSIFACLVAEKIIGTNNNKSTTSQQRRARVAIESISQQQSTQEIVFILRVEYLSAQKVFQLISSSDNKNKTSSSSSSSSSINNTNSIPDNQHTFRFAFQYNKSKLNWVKPFQEEDLSASATFSSFSNFNNAAQSSSSSSRYDYECSVVFSSLKKLSLNNVEEEGNFVVANCIISFEKNLEARLFARQMHCLFELYLPSVSLNSSFSSVLQSKMKKTETCQSCALVALPLRWWFEAWSQNLHNINNNNENTENTEDDSTLKRTKSMFLADDCALVLTSSGVTEWTWNLSQDDDDDENDDNENETSNYYEQQEQEGEKNKTGKRTRRNPFYTNVEYPLPLMKNPTPTTKSDSSVQWAICRDASALASAMEGASVFSSSSTSASSATQTTSATQTNSNYLSFLSQQIPINSKQRQVSETSSTTKQEVATSKTIGSMNSVSPVVLDSRSKRFFIAGKNQGEKVLELSSSNHLSYLAAGEKDNSVLLKPFSWNLKSSFSEKKSTSSSANIQFVAVPLQEAIIEASTISGSNNFVVGPSSQNIGAVGKVLCCYQQQQNSSTQNEERNLSYYENEPTPIVFDLQTKCLGLIQRRSASSSSSLDNKNKNQHQHQQHWANLLIQVCSKFRHLIPVVLLPMRGLPGFPLLLSSSSRNFQDDNNTMIPPSSPFASAGNNNPSFDSSSPTGNNNLINDSLESILLLSALRGTTRNSNHHHHHHYTSSSILASSSSATTSSNNIKSAPTQVLSPLYKSRPQQLNISVVGSVGCGKSTFVKALQHGKLEDEVVSSSFPSNQNNNTNLGNNRNQSVSYTTASNLIFGSNNNQNNQNSSSSHTHSSSSSSTTTSSSGPSERLISDQLIFGCTCKTCSSSGNHNNYSFSHHHHQTTATNMKSQNKTRAVLVEAPALALPALSGTISSSDIVLCIVNCLLPHSLTWIEEKIKPVLDQLRTPTLNIDGSAVHYTGPICILVTVNSTSYRRTVTHEDVVELSSKIKNCIVADFEFGSSSGDVLESQYYYSPSDNTSTTTTNRLAGFSNDDAKIATATIGRAVQACAAYATLLNNGFLPLQAETLVHVLLGKWDKLLSQAHERGVNFGCSVAENSSSFAHSTEKNNLNLLQSFLLLDPAQYGLSLDETFCQWCESDMNLLKLCCFSVLDCANYLSLLSSSRELRGQLIKYIFLKHSTFRDHYHLGVVKHHHHHQKNNQEMMMMETETATTTGLHNTHNTVSSNIISIIENSPRIRRSRKIAKKLFSIFSLSTASSPGTERSPILTSRSSAEPTPRNFDQNENIQTTDLNNNNSASNSLPGSLLFTKNPAGLSQAGVLFLLSTFGIVVGDEWISNLWSEMHRARIGTNTISQPIWLRFLHLPVNKIKTNTSSSSDVVSSTATTTSINNRTASIFSIRQLALIDFSFVVFHWILEIAKNANSDFLEQARDGWLSRPRDIDDNDGDGDGYFNSKGGITPPTPRTPTSPTSSSSQQLPSIHCRSCNTLQIENNVVRCVICERHSCLFSNSNNISASAVTAASSSKNDHNHNTQCSFTIGGREIEQQKQALSSIARTTSGTSSHDQKVLAQMLKQLPHVCKTCLLAHPPIVWQPDNEATCCFVCSKPFSAISRRKHHCRQCSYVVCNNCSKKEAPCFGYDKLQRICIRCYENPSPFLGMNREKTIKSQNYESNNNNQLANVPTEEYDGEENTMIEEEKQREQQQQQQRISSNSSSSTDEDDEEEEEDSDNESLRSGSTTTSTSFFSSRNQQEEDPRTVFAPWAHLVLNSEPDTVYQMPWYETLDDEVIGQVLGKLNNLIQDAVKKKKHIPRMEYVVRQPGFLEETDKEIENAAVGEEWLEEFEPDES